MWMLECTKKQKLAEDKWLESQCNYRKGWSSTDIIFHHAAASGEVMGAQSKVVFHFH